MFFLKMVRLLLCFIHMLYRGLQGYNVFVLTLQRYIFFLSSKLLSFFFLVLDRLFVCRKLCVRFLVLVTLDVRCRGFFDRNK